MTYATTANLALRPEIANPRNRREQKMAILETHRARQIKHPNPRGHLSLSLSPSLGLTIGGALASVSRALYRTGLWLVYGGAAAEMIFHADAE